MAVPVWRQVFVRDPARTPNKETLDTSQTSCWLVCASRNSSLLVPACACVLACRYAQQSRSAAFNLSSKQPTPDIQPAGNVKSCNFVCSRPHGKHKPDQSTHILNLTVQVRCRRRHDTTNCDANWYNPRPCNHADPEQGDPHCSGGGAGWCEKPPVLAAKNSLSLRSSVGNR